MLLVKWNLVPDWRDLTPLPSKPQFPPYSGGEAPLGTDSRAAPGSQAALTRPQGPVRKSLPGGDSKPQGATSIPRASQESPSIVQPCSTLCQKQRFPFAHTCAANFPLLGQPRDSTGSGGFLLILLRVLAMGPASLNTRETPPSFILLHLILCSNAK